ncbi:TPA: fibronectin type III domain-containing protein [Candidatus Poribacteria bacterium]|nr:fibronectin type III domain-containing protein [Candidatus Poribacteria bacterium]HIC03714.1 fibronectin type III domain-containing protein [Candidatus Poribacteria bacterium]HIO48692.1 fibronectin type III domain-containing protein [Candidatus Poribacteria bacterium]HIO79850.1 fibronectin type III domain-containing protein [Candidatus Poribacteria bacterium]
MKLNRACLLGLILIFTCKITFAQSSEFSSEEFRVPDEAVTENLPAPPTNIEAKDKKNDDGTSIIISWSKSVDDDDGANNVTGYNILRKSSEGDFETITESPIETGKTDYTDDTVERGIIYSYLVQAINASGATADSEATSVEATASWFHTGKKWLFLSVVLFSVVVIYSIYHATRSGKDIFIRRIPGLEAVDEAIGRATEMGRSILYIVGLGGVSNVATIASMNILSQVARRTANYETALRVPCSDPIVMNVVREMVKTAYLDEGHPDAYHEEDIFFLTESQFAYAAGVDGIMLREKPAAVFLQGTFFAESLILAETGNSVGAIQIAGTDKEHQLPFFIAACDYTLIGEELYAASAYLSREPMLLGSLKGQDYGKLMIFGAIVVGIILELLGINWITTFFDRVSN